MFFSLNRTWWSLCVRLQLFHHRLRRPDARRISGSRPTTIFPVLPATWSRKTRMKATTTMRMRWATMERWRNFPSRGTRRAGTGCCPHLPAAADPAVGSIVRCHRRRVTRKHPRRQKRRRGVLEAPEVTEADHLLRPLTRRITSGKWSRRFRRTINRVR